MTLNILKICHISLRQTLRLTGALLFLVVLLKPLSADSAPKATEIRNESSNKKTLLLIGDSLSAAYNMKTSDGWVALLEKQLQNSYPNWQVVNTAVSGDTIENAIQHLNSYLTKGQPDLILIEIGGNDGLRGHPLPNIQKNLESLVKKALSATPNVGVMEIMIPPNYGPIYTQKFRAIYHNIAQKFSVALIPFPLDKIATDPSLMQADGLHPTAAAQPLLLEQVWPEIRDLVNK
ncbi:MAG: arylesterase [Pseudomonadota bacterium]